MARLSRFNVLVISYKIFLKNNDLREQIRNHYYGFIDLNNNLLHIPSIEVSDLQIFTLKGFQDLGLRLWCLTPLSTIFQLYRGIQFYWYSSNLCKSIIFFFISVYNTK